MIDRKKTNMIIECMLILYWLLFLQKVDSYYSSYLILGILSLYLKFYRHILKKDVLFSKKRYLLTTIFSIALSCMVVLANYKFFNYGISRLYILRKIIVVILVFMGGKIVFEEIMVGLATWNGIEGNERKNNLRDKYLWIGMWTAIVALNSIILFETLYPGVLTNDSMSQMWQILNGSYSNHHPFYHTQIIRFLITIGMWMFDDINKAIALYSCFSIAMMALCFVYVIGTIDKMLCNRKITVCIFVWYLMMPFHITYSVTMWKDVFFGACVTSLVVGIYRYLYVIGNKKINFIVIIAMALGVCLFRSNGWIAFLLTTLIFIIIYRAKYKKLVIAFLGILVVSFVLNHQVLAILNVPQTDTIFALSIPTQQIARVVVDGNELTTEERNLLEQVVYVETIPENYTDFISDNIIGAVRNKGNQQYIESNKIEFIKLYFKLGLKYPKSFIKAWIDQTRGYWNSGYNYWRWTTSIQENDLGIQRTVKSEIIESIFDGYLYIWETEAILQPFISIGLHTWILMFCLYNALVKRKKAEAFILVPFLAVIATPVFSEFRYIYAVFCGIPFIIVGSLMKTKKLERNLDE